MQTSEAVVHPYARVGNAEIILYNVSPIDGKEHHMIITSISREAFQEGWKMWETGQKIQDALPELSPEAREFLISGITPNQWDKMFPDE